MTVQYPARSPTAPPYPRHGGETKLSLSVRDKIKEEVQAIASERDLKDYQAFGYWYLERIEDYSAEEAERLVVDGAWDGGRDAVDFDEGEAALRIYQFKYSSTKGYVENALKDIQRALPIEVAKLDKAQSLTLQIVALSKVDAAFHGQVKKVRTWIRTYIRKNHPHIPKESVEVELLDLPRFAQLFEELFGVEATLTFRGAPSNFNGAVLGLVDLQGLKSHVDDEALFAFNIRKFLGLKKGSVNVEIKLSLNDDQERDRFWRLNNGIVCLCTSADVKGSEGKFENLTIVNGAQTVSTSARFLNDNPAITEPVWCVAKIIPVVNKDLSEARKLTKTSNTQTPASSTDLRSVDIGHSRITQWLEKHMNLQYSYRRGVGGPRGENVVPMKELAQAFIAFWTMEPNVPFSRAGSLFSKNSYYDEIFPEAEIENLHQGMSKKVAEDEDEAAVMDFLRARILPWRLLTAIRAHIRKRIAEEDKEKQWRSAAYHLVWIYKQLLDEIGVKDLETVEGRLVEIVETSATSIFDAFTDFCDSKELAIPRDLKSDKLVTEMLKGNFFSLSTIKTARTDLKRLLT